MFYTILGFTKSCLGKLNDYDGFFQIIPGSNKIIEPINNKGFDTVHLKCDCIVGSLLNGIGHSILYSFAWYNLPGHKNFKEPRVKLFEKTKKSVLFHTSFYVQDGDNRPIDFERESVSFTCQLIKRWSAKWTGICSNLETKPLIYYFQ